MAAKLDVRPGSVRSRRPPEPDILATIEGRGRVAFELVQWIDEPFAEMQSLALRGEQRGAVSYGRDFLSCLRPKCRDSGSYKTPHPVELVVWTTGSEFESRLPVGPSVKDRAKQLLDMSAFERLWVVRFSRTGDKIWLRLKRSPRPRPS